MKSVKWLMMVVALSLAPASHAEFGVGVNVNAWKMDDAELNRHRQNTLDIAATPSRTKLDSGTFFGEIELFYERPIVESLSWGVRAGYSTFPTAEMEDRYSNFADYDSGNKAKAKAVSFPVSGYVRKSFASSPVSLLGGAGLEFIQAETKYEYEDPVDSLSGTFKDEKWAPFIQVGADCRVHSRVTIGFNMKYLFSAELDDFRGTPSSTYLAPGQTKLVMRNDPGFGEFIDTENSPVPGSARAYQVDFGGLRFGINAKFHF